jgi:hypothetical protein
MPQLSHLKLNPVSETSDRELCEAEEPTQAPGQPASGDTVGMDPADVERWRALAALLGTAHLVSGVLPSAWVDLLFGRVSDGTRCERQCVWCPSLKSLLAQLLRTKTPFACMYVYAHLHAYLLYARHVRWVRTLTCTRPHERTHSPPCTSACVAPPDRW